MASTEELPITVDAAVASRRSVFAWLSNAGIVKLNLILILSLISSYATGYDGSMMNGLQSLDTWKDSFNNPDASELALYVFYFLISISSSLNMTKQS